jgi:L-ascorbate metabolism protein UlaG (beta-lactamase superfamily)
MQKHHLNPTEALEAFLDLGAEKMVPIHFGTFKLSSEKMDEPIEWLKRVSSERNLSENIVILKSGETAEI